MPEQERNAKFGDDFTTFLTAPSGLNLQAGGDVTANEAAVRAYVASVPTLQPELDDLDQLENPLDATKTLFSAGNQNNQLLVDLWNNLPQATRAGYHNNINNWIDDSTIDGGLGFTNSSPAQNASAIQTYCATAPGTAPGGSSWANAYTAASAGTYVSAASTGTSSDYLQFLKDKGFIDNPPPPVATTTGSP